jgi:hypothetical protein
MDSNRFDALSVSGSRRCALALALSAALAPLFAWEDAAAHNPLKSCKKKSGKQKKACLKKAKAHNAQHAAEPAPLPPPAAPGRKIITRTFSNTTPITILPGPDGVEVATPAAPYPSLIAVAGFTNGRILDVNVTLHGVSHTYPADIDILLAAAHLPGLNAVVMSDAGVTTGVSDVTLTLDDQAAAALPSSGALATGAFRPANHTASRTEEFPAPAPTPSGAVALSLFNGSDPNGTWQLFVVDDYGEDGGSIAKGWSLEIRAEVDA